MLCLSVAVINLRSLINVFPAFITVGSSKPLDLVRYVIAESSDNILSLENVL
ncbi:MAG: hypothetical protein QOK67_08640 [Nitrososphaeraceae archaeon]|nr:hypothetical protein [Nitrososphaeraceae archaeon]